MHAKTIIVYESVVMSGSVNMTHNGFEHNKEHMFCIRDKAVVRELVDDFSKDWACDYCHSVLEKEIGVMKEKEKEKIERRNANRKPDGRSKSLSRSLTSELEAA